MPSERHTGQRVVLGDLPHGLVVAPRPEAERLAELHRALHASGTWGELLRRLSPANRRSLERHLLSPVERHLDLDDVEISWPGERAPFDADELPGFADGDWPPWPPRQALSWVPEEVRALGRVEQTIHNGPYLIFDPGDADRVAAALRAAGYAVERDDVLVDAACGGYRSPFAEDPAFEVPPPEDGSPEEEPVGRGYLYDREEGRPIVAEGSGEAPLGLDRLEGLLAHLAGGGHPAVLRRFAVWCAESAPGAEGTAPLLGAARADADAWEAAPEGASPDVSALEAARAESASAAMAASAVGLRHGAANAAAFLAARAAAHPDPHEAAREAARLRRLCAELAPDGPTPAAVTQQQLDWLLDHLP